MDWNNLNLKEKTSKELRQLHHNSYYRYAPPNMHGLWFVFGGLSLGVVGMLLYMYFGLEAVHPNRVSLLWKMVVGLTIFGIFAIYRYVIDGRKSAKRWDEMESIRKQINAEFQRRDEQLGLK